MYLAVREVFESHSIVALNSADMFFFRKYWCYHAISFTSLLSFAIWKFARKNGQPFLSSGLIESVDFLAMS